RQETGRRGKVGFVDAESYQARHGVVPRPRPSAERRAHQGRRRRGVGLSPFLEPAMAISVTKRTVKTITYDVAGATLAELWADIQKKGPKHKGATRAGKTTCKINLDAASSQFDFKTTQGKKDFESEAKMSTGALTYDCTIEMPKLKSDAGLSAAAKKEWAR